MQSESYAIIGNSLTSLYQIDKESALNKVTSLSDDVKESLGEAITTIYINEEDKTNLPFIANHVLEGMFLTQNPRIQQLYAGAFKWIAESDNKEAITNITNDFVKLGKQYKKSNFDKMAINLLNQIVFLQQQSTNSNKEELIIILKTGMAKLME